MALNRALDFLKQACGNEDFRSSCYSFDNKEALLTHFGFDEVEFEDAINMNLVKCQTYEQAEVFQQLKMWFSIL